MNEANLKKYIYISGDVMVVVVITSKNLKEAILIRPMKIFLRFVLKIVFKKECQALISIENTFLYIVKNNIFM